MKLGNRRKSDNLIDNRGKGGRVKKVGGFSILGIVVALVYSYLNKDPSYLVKEVAEQATTASSSQQSTNYQPSEQENQYAVLTSQVLASTEDVWHEVFKQYGYDYPEPKLELFTGQVRSACGVASAQMGPFYCSADQKVFIDLGFLNDMQRMGATGDFAYAYVIAHEVGHHVSNVTGSLPKVHKARQRLNKKQANQLSVLLELQADCYAGVWGHYANNYQKILSQGDIEEGIRAAQAVGDDTLTKGKVHPDNFTHGTAKQRMSWFMKGMETGKMETCDTFGQAGVKL